MPWPQTFTALVDTLFGLSAGQRVDVHAVWMAELGFPRGVDSQRAELVELLHLQRGDNQPE